MYLFRWRNRTVYPPKPELVCDIDQLAGSFPLHTHGGDLHDGVLHDGGRHDTSCEGKKDSSDSRRAHSG